MTDNDQLTRARELLMATNKWVRRIEERADMLSASFLDNIDPTPLRKKVDRFLRETDSRP
jgi:hypothetical protein